MGYFAPFVQMVSDLCEDHDAQSLVYGANTEPFGSAFKGPL